MDSVASFDEENSDSDYMNVSSEESFEEEEFEENVSTKRRSLQLTKRKDGPEFVRNALSKLNNKAPSNQSPMKMSLKRKFSFPTTSTKKENDGPSSISFQLISASQSPEENSSISIPTTPTMELEAVNSASLLMPAPGGTADEPPYFPEKYGKLCAFCNLGERSQLGQGEMLRLEFTEEEISCGSEKGASTSMPSTTEEDSKNGNDDINKIIKSNSGGGLLQLNRRQKGLNKCKNPIQTSEYVDEFEKIGHQDPPVDLNSLVESGYFYVHRLCALWSFGVMRDPVKETLSGVSSVLQQSLNRKCSYCNHYGASATCKMTCQKAFHFPCIAASGGFQVFQSCALFCNDHLNQVPLVCSEDVHCVTCSGLGDVSNLMMCVGCGDHYHGTCIGIAQQPGIRAGWQCKACRSCQICRIPDNTEGRSLACENCDKLYHSHCLRPIMATIPKYGWKCRCCRVCSDCGARTPGAGASSRWHNHYTVCDSCYQQRNKGYSCPICRKAYRAAAYREMVKCFICQKFVHSTCDSEADLTAYERRKEINPEYEYTCGLCKAVTQNDRIAVAIRRNNSGEEDNFSASQESLSAVEDVDMEIMEIRNVKDDYGLGKGKPFVASKIAKKRLGLTVAALNAQRPKGIGKVGFQKRARTFELGRKRGPKSKMRGIFGVPGLGLQRPIADSSKQIDDEPGTENRLVLCSAKDRFVLTQDICVMCGAIGTDQEGCLISCAQCGQCYHPYCVSVKVTKEILQKGWRCLDCTVCEGCGEKNDEARLILCDDCDISYHIYCMEPPLDTVPQGTWKCKWCAICYKCGASDPGLNCSWQNSYTECGPCSSQNHCPQCMEVYSDGELIIQCTTCDRWLHCLCDSIKNEADAEKCAEEGYICLLCRPKDILPPHLQMKKKLPSFSSQSSQAAKDDSFDDIDNVFSLALEGSHFVDGVYLSEHGLQQIKSLQTEPKRAKRKPKVNPENEKDAAILAAIESVVAGSADNSMEEIKLELMDPNEEAQIYKDGMEWSTSDPAPDGFSLFTTEAGQVVLRKKRQRNLQKLGIGGFSVRNRAVRTKEEEPPNSASQLAADETKKKKPNRRKQKNKLVETYPAYLQEAFFGRTLLDSNVKVKLESSSSDEETKSNVSDDKTIKLSLDELKMIETMRAKQQQKMLEEQKVLQLNLEKSQQTMMTSGSHVLTNQKMQIEAGPSSSKMFTGAPLNISAANSQPEIKTELGLLDDDENNSDTDALKDVLGLPGDLLDNDLVNTIMNEDDDLTKNSNALDDEGKDCKDDLADILSPHFNLDCKYVEDMLFKSVLTDESQESQESMLTNSLTSYSTQSTPSHQSETQQMHLNQPATPLSANSLQMNPLQSPQPGISNINPMMANIPQSPQIINPQMNTMNQPIMGLQQPNPLHMQPNIIHRQNSQPGTPGPMPGMSSQRGNPFNSAPTFPNQPQWNASTDNDFDMSSSSITSGAILPAPKVNNHQKTSERMAEDEKLGDKSSISAVLYANQNHPELKTEFPQWSDRYKQIMKKWRALSGDQKKPYLSLARDNRSAQQAELRVKKAQQVAPDLSPDNGTTTSTNSTSPALSSTLSESSSLIDVNVLQQQQQLQQQQTQIVSTQPQQIQVDQDKITAQQKSMKEAEQERQWKALQATRAREQQMGMPPDPRMIHMNAADPNVQLQISTTMNDGSMSPVASPSPNSRNQFVAPSNKGRMMMNPQSPSSNFQHPGRPVSTQLQRQQSQNRMNQSPFSPQASTPQSPHDAFPGSPSSEIFARPPLDEQQFLHSPQTPKPVVQQQSPVHAASGSNLNFGQISQSQNQTQAPNIRSLDNMGGYVQAPGTPRPSFNPGQTRATVYARPDMFCKPPFVMGTTRSDQFSPQSPQDQNNRQLRDLLQRQQAPTNLPSPSPQVNIASPSFSMDNEQMKNQAQQSQQQPMSQAQKQQGDNTFRQPLPPGLRQPRMQSMVGGQMIRSTQLVNPQRMVMNPDNRPRLGIRPGTVLNPQQMLAVQQQQQLQQNQMGMNHQRMTLNSQGNFSQVQGEIMTQNQPGMNDQNNMISPQRMVGQNVIMQQNIQGGQVNPQGQSVGRNENIQVPTTINQTGNPTDVEGIPDSVTAELEKLEQDKNVGMDEVSDDILTGLETGLGDDEDDLLDSLTDMGMGDGENIFNILEYADPELDTTDDEKTNILDTLELDESENAKEDKLKNLEAEKLAKANAVINAQQQVHLQRAHVPIPGSSNVVSQIPSTVSQIDPQSLNQNVGTSQQGPQVISQVGGQQILLNQQGGINNFQRQQIRIKAIPPNQISDIQHIHQQMMAQLQQAAANGKPMPLGTRLVANNVVGTVVGPNNIQLNYAPNQQRLQQVRMINPNMIQGNQNNQRMVLPQMPQSRPNMMQNPQQPMNPNIQGLQSPMGSQTLIGQQPQQNQNIVPPPPYPEPPPPYPGQSISGQAQEQPLLLEDLLEQEKREQARQTGGAQMDQIMPNQNQQSILNDQDYEKLRADVLTSTTQSIPMTQLNHQPQQLQQPQNQFMPRAVINKQWRAQAPIIPTPPSTSTSELVRSVPVFQANLQTAPSIPPENIISEVDKITQANYEAWLNQQNTSLQEQLRYYETEILELRKLKKSLKTKERQLTKAGNKLNDVDALTLKDVTTEQEKVQKYLESARKQARNHLALKQDYEAKKSAKQMANNPHMVSSPVGQMNEQSPMMSPSPGGMSQQNMIQQPVQSPLGNPMVPSQSPLHSPSPMMSAQSPGPTSIMQSPSTHMNAMSPYNTMQQSPRIGTPHSQIDESPFSPNSGPIDSPSMAGRLTSPAPRMTSPQHRPSTPMQMMSRMGNNAGQFNQQNVVMGQQTRFVRPQQMMQNDGNNRIGMRMPANFQQIGQNPNIIRQGQYNAMDGSQNQNQQNMQLQQNPNMDPQVRQMQIRQMQQLRQQQQQQMMNQQAQIGQMNQMSQQNPQMMQQSQQQTQMMQQGQQNPQLMQQGQQNVQMMQQAQQQNPQMMSHQSNQSPNHQQPQSPLINQSASSPMPRSPMVHYQQQHQNPNSPMMMDNSPRPSYMQQHQQQQHQQGMIDHGNQNQMMQQGGGGGGNGMHNPIPHPPFGRFGRIKLGLRGGSPMWGNNSNNGNGNRSNADVMQLIKKAQQQEQAQQAAKEAAQRNVAGKTLPSNDASQQATSSRQIQPKAKTSLLKKPPASIANAKIKSLVSTDYNDDDSSNGTPPISPLSQKTRLKGQALKSVSDDIVVVDSSPDEKQRMLDYDDDNDKVVTTLTEVSLNSTAQDIGDSDDMIEAFDTSELVSSPLVTEPEATDYVLFEPHVVHLDDSNESLKEIMSTNLFEENIHQEQPKAESSKNVNNDSEIMFVVEPIKEKGSKNVGTCEDFEAMIDSGKDDDESETEVVTTEKRDPIAQEPTRKSAESQIFKTLAKPIQDLRKEIKFPSVGSASSSVSITLPANLISRPNIHTTIAGVSAHKKLVKNALPTTAKVSVGNKSITVPVVLQNMQMQNKGASGDGQQGSKKIITSNPLTISNLKKNPALFSVSGPKINTSAIVTLSLNKGMSRPIQTVQRFQKPGQQTQSIIVPISSCITSSPSSHASTNISSVGLISSAQNSVTSKMSTSCASPILTFSSKMPTLTMTQDASLPSKIFEDDEISPDFALQHDESESVSTGDYKGQEPTTSKGVEEFKEAVEEIKGSEPPAEEKTKSFIPVHVKINSRESSQSPVLNQTQRLLTANMSQLSPLSQPIEINTNTHNATQQIRSIMSSINSNEDTKNKSEAEQTNVVSTSTQLQQSIPKTILRSISTPTTSQSGGQSGSELRMIVSQQNASVPSSPNIQTSQAGNILLVKQIRTPSTQSVTIPSSTNSTIVMMSQSGQIQSQGSVIISNKPSNLLSILSNQQASNVKNSEVKMEPPSTSSTETVGIQKSITILKTNPTITNLLNTNSFKRSKSTDDATVSKESQEIAAAKRLSLESSNTIKSEPFELPVVKEVVTSVQKAEPPRTPTPTNVCPNKTLNAPSSKPEDSQNVLLKQLLQNSGSSVASPLTRSVPGIISNQRAPSLGVFSSLEAQLARPIIPPTPAKPIVVSSQPLLNQFPSATPLSVSTETAPKTTSSTKVVSRETSFVSQSPTTPTPTQSPATSIPVSIQSMMEKKPFVLLNRNDIPASMMMSGNNSVSVTKNLPQQTTFESPGMAPPNMAVKREMISPGGSVRTAGSPTNIPTLVKSISQSSLGSGTTTPVPFESPLIDVKKEIMDDSSQSESISSDVSMVKTENQLTTPATRDDGMGELTEESPAKTAQEIANELKKKKRREYQKNRRQMQMSKEKGLKKPRKLQKSEEDYDSFMDNLMMHIKALPQMQILEPLLPKNFGVCPIYGCNELNKLSSSKRYDITSGELLGTYGNAELANVSDFYNTKPFGGLSPKSEQAPVSTQRGFYDQEFPPIKFEEEDHHRSKYDLLVKDRDIDTPETIVSSSSPECVMEAPPCRFPGLKLIKEDDEDEDEIANFVKGRMSPPIPAIVAPIPIRLKSGISLTSDNPLSDQENESKKEFGMKSCFGPPTPLKDNNNNVTVTLTLTSSAAEDIMGVLKSLANILNIPAPTAYQIVERTTTPPSQKLGLYRLRGKDGKEGQPVDIQTILNGTAKFCRHCDVVILNNVIKAKASEFPLLVNTELESDELYFCGKTCYKQFQWRPINMMDDKTPNISADDKSLDALTENSSKPDSQPDVKVITEVPDTKRKRVVVDDLELEKEDFTEKRQKLMKIKTYCANSFPQIHKQKKMSDREITELLFRMNITVNSAPKILDDTRKCIFCHQTGDGVADGTSRLLNYDVDKWVHLNCALWSDGVYETENGALMNLETTLQTSLNSQCTMCNHLGATIKCFKARCGSIYHLSCAMKDSCVFYKNKTTMCNIHAPKSEKDNELTTLSVQRRVYVERDENRQVASIMHHSDLTNLMRVGSLILLNVGQLLPHQLQAFHTPNYIYPIGYKIIRFFWSMRQPNKRCRYICYIVDVSGRPEFRILVKEVNQEDIELRDETPKKVWQRVLAEIAKLRNKNQLVQVFPKYISGEDLFGLAEPAVVRILESLPGVETLSDYRFKYGRNPLLELPLAINPSGAARTEPRIKQNVSWKKPHTQRTGSSSQRPAFVPTTSAGDVVCPYSKQFVHSKSSQYKKMKLEWRNNVFLARSKIQGLGLYAARDLEKHTMVIEYIGEVIRGELSELREKQYEDKNRGIYMFRLDEDRVIDATLSGGLARYINHSCNPNCVTEIVEVDREYRIIIFAKRRINRGEELSYDYKFDIEDESRKIACNCMQLHCKKYMN